MDESIWGDTQKKYCLRSVCTLKFWFFIDSAVNFHSLQQNAVLQID